MKKLYLLLVLVAFGFCQNSFAATRAIHFMGLAETNFPKVGVLYGDLSGTCNVVLTNLSQSDQEILKVETVLYSTTSGSTTFADRSAVATWKTQNTQRISSTGVAADCFGTANALAPGSSCHIQYGFEAYAFNKPYALCAGKITVKDKVSSAVGSLTAVGSVYVVQESKVVAGVLSAALFSSGSAKAVTDGAGVVNSDFANVGSGYMGPDYRTSNMNLYCAASCTNHTGSPVTNERKLGCKYLCGDDANESEPLMTDASTQPFIRSPVQNSNPILLLNPQYNIVGAVSDMAKQVSQTPTHPMTQSYNIQASPRLASGIVHEMTIGPHDSICSANPGFGTIASQGSLNASTSEMRTPGNKYLRLYCANRWGRDDLLSGVEMNVPFTINGGNPF